MTPLSTSALPFAMPSSDVFFASPKKVFAHYFRSFQLSIDNAAPPGDYYNTQLLSTGGEKGKHTFYGGFLRQRPLPVAVNPAVNWRQGNMQSEVSMAIARGITGFCFDVLSLNDGLIQIMLTAAAAVDPRFKIIPMLDMNALGIGLTITQASNYLTSLVASPALKHLDDGRLVLAAYNATAQSPAWWLGLIGTLNAQGINVAFLPVLLGEPNDAGALNSIAWGVGGWGTATPGPALALTAAGAHAVGLKAMFPVITQEFRPKDQIFWESSNSVAFRNAWTAAIGNGADWVQLVTWNDYSESCQVSPYTDATLNPSIGTAFYDLNAFYATWFATGKAPPITQDVLYWVHRRETGAAAHANQPSSVKAVLAGGGPEEDYIELLAFLTEPGIIEITIGGVVHDFPATGALSQLPGGGFTSVKVPLVAGVPVFSLQRNGSHVFSFPGAVQIYGPEGLPSGVLDMTYWGGSITKAGPTSYAFT